LTEALTTDEEGGPVGMSALMSLGQIGKAAVPAIIMGLRGYPERFAAVT